MSQMKNSDTALLTDLAPGTVVIIPLVELVDMGDRFVREVTIEREAVIVSTGPATATVRYESGEVCTIADRRVRVP